MRKPALITRLLLVSIMLIHPLFYFSMYSGDAEIHLVMFQRHRVTIGLFAWPVRLMFQDLFFGDRPTFHLIIFMGLSVVYSSVSQDRIKAGEIFRRAF